MSALFPDDPGRRRRLDRALLALGAILALVLVLRAARKQDSVLDRNQEWGARFLAREDPYADTLRGGRLHGPYPPSYAIVCAPLALLPDGAARVLWASAQIGALAATFLLLRRWLTRGWPDLAPHASVLFALALLLASRYLLRDMAGGGGNLLYATTLLWGLELALTGRPLAGGLLAALPIVCKPSLGLLLFVLPARQRWRASCVVLVAVPALAWSPGFWFGHAAWSRLWERWAADVVAFASVDDLSRADQVPAGFPVDETGMNQSLRAALGRAAGASPEPEHAEETHEWVRWGGRFGALAAILAAAWAGWRARGPRAEILGALALLPATLLASPIAWKAHHAILLGPFAVLVACALSARRWTPLATYLALYWIACGLLSEEIVGKSGKAALQSASVVTWFTVALLAILVALALHASRDERRSRSARSAT